MEEKEDGWMFFFNGNIIEELILILQQRLTSRMCRAESVLSLFPVMILTFAEDFQESNCFFCPLYFYGLGL